VSLGEFFLAWRTTSLPDREVIDGLVHPLHTGPSAALTAALAHWPGTYYWAREPDGRHLVLTRPLAHRRARWALHVLLLLATLFTTTFVGAVFRGTLPLDPNPLALLLGTYALPTHFLRAWATGLTFSLPLVAVLLCHELGHYLTARHYQLDVSPPYFIPFPFLPWSIGTMGAFIRLRTIVSDRRQLLDVGIAGPLAGLAIALPALWIGLRLSDPLPGFDQTGMLLGIGLDKVPLGDSLVTLALRHLVHGGAPAILLHPVAVAGWFGLFVTMLNLLPVFQLDGGHILYATLPRRQQRIALAFWILIVLLGWFWRGWLLWGLLVLLLSRGRLGHPPVLDTHRPLPESRRMLAWVALGLFASTFVPVPFRM
jgi:Zn-dependent protease